MTKNKSNIQWLMGVAILLSFFSMQVGSAPLFNQYLDASQPTAKDIETSRQLLVKTQPKKLREPLTLKPFHQRYKEPILDSKAYCTRCHLSVPHSRQLRSRAFLNMHTQYIACETCHFRPEGISFNYRWFNYTNQKAEDNIAGRLHADRGKDDKTQLVARTANVKIAPFYQGQPALMTYQDAKAKEIKEQWKSAEEQEKPKIHAVIHAPLQTKGPRCDVCHTPKQSLLDFTLLGATDKQLSKLQYNTIADFFKHYQPENAKQPKGTQTEPKEQRIRITDLLR
ncbi:MAG: multiheme c-type cytochrome [Methylococcaceae bacterium]